MTTYRIGLAIAAFLMLPLLGSAQTVPQSQAEITLSFAPLVRQASPAVVNIYAERVVQGRSGVFSGDPFFEQFFRDFGTPTPRVQNSLGSGVILSETGLVMSNFHVVGGATDIRVVLTDRREFTAKVIMADEESDLAVLRLDGALGLPYLPLRDSDSVEVGELVLAIGNPFGVGQTVSSGIVSGLARSTISLGRGYFLQTDAPINPGNSGGALIDMAGRLLGINSAILSQSGGSNGVGFAIPSNLVAQVLAQAEAGHVKFERPWAGVTGQTVDSQMAEAMGLSRPEGVVLTELHPQSPFGAAGLRAGDVLLSIGEAEVNSPQEVMFRLAVAGVGESVPVDFWRNGARQSVTVALIAPPASPDRQQVTITDGGLAGLSVAQIDPALIAEMGLPITAQGVVITGIEGVLAHSGMAPGDILLGINGVAIETPAEVVQVAKSGGRGWLVDALRAGQRLRLRFRL